MIRITSEVGGISMKDRPLIDYIVQFIICVTVWLMAAFEIRKYGTQDMLLCALRWFAFAAMIYSGMFLSTRIKSAKEERRKEKEKSCNSKDSEKQ